jgi:hypothetical protein
MDILTKQLPRKVIDRLLFECPGLPKKTYAEIKELCIDFDYFIRNPDPLEHGDVVFVLS